MKKKIALLLILSILLNISSILNADTSSEPELSTFIRITYSNNKFVLETLEGEIYTSKDCFNWYKGEKDLKYDYFKRYKVITNGSVYVRTDEGYKDEIHYSSDNVNWEKAELPVEFGTDINGMVTDGKRFLAACTESLGKNSKAVILTSKDGIDWSKTYLASDYASSIAWNGKIFVIVGSSFIMTSSDGTSWSKVNVDLDAFFSKVVWNGKMFVAITGLSNTILSSKDGEKWIKNNVDTSSIHSNGMKSGKSRDLRNIAYNDNTTAVISEYCIFVSKDSLHWSKVTNKDLLAGYKQTLVAVNSKVLNLDVKPVTVNGRLLVPLRSIFEALGAKINWDSKSNKVTAIKDNTEVVIKVGSNIAYINGIQKTMDVAAQYKNGRVLIPLRFVSESFGAEVKWDSEFNAVFVWPRLIY